MGELSAPRQPGQQTLRTHLARVWRLPGRILELVKAGKAANASLLCLAISASALVVLFLSSLFVSLCMAALLVPLSLVSQRPVGNEPALLALIVVLGLPGLAAAIIALVGPLLGAVFGVLGLFQRGQGILGIVGLVLNSLLFGFVLFVAVLVVGFAA